VAGAVAIAPSAEHTFTGAELGTRPLSAEPQTRFWLEVEG
jgi:hypothetical protein